MSNSCNPNPSRLLCQLDAPGKNTGVDCHFLLQGSSWPRDPTQVSCITDTLYQLSYEGEEEKLKFYITSCSFCLCNPACSLQSLDHIGLRKWGLKILGTGAYFTHPCPALCNRPSPCKPADPLNHACPCIKKALNPFVWGSELEVLIPLGPPA